MAVEVEDPKEKIPLLVSVVDDGADEAKIPPLPPSEDPPLPKEKRLAPFVGAPPFSAPAAASAAAAVVEVVKVSLRLSAEDDTQKEKVGFMEELQLLVGARAWDKLEKEKVWFVLIAENEAK